MLLPDTFWYLTLIIYDKYVIYQIIAGYILLIKAASSLASVIIQSVTFLMSHMVPLHAGLFMHVYKQNNLAVMLS